jgi:HEAT repeat protein
MEVFMEPQERQALIERTSSSEEEARREAMERLKEGLSASDLQWLIRPLSDESWRVRKEAIEGLSRIQPDDDLVKKMILLLDPSRELTLRNSIVEVLERMGKSVVPTLLTHLDIKQADVRKFLVDILGNIADPTSIPGLLQMLRDPDDNIRAAASEALAAIGDPSTSNELIKAMEDSDEWVVFSILGALARLGNTDALPVFFRYLDNQILSKPAVNGIGLMGTVKEGIMLMEKIPGLSRGAAKAAFTAVGSIFRRMAFEGDLASADELVRLVSRKVDESMVQFFAAQVAVSEQIDHTQNLLAVLGMIGDRPSLDAVLQFVDDENLQPDVDLAIYTAVRNDLSLLLPMLEHHDPLVRRKAVQTIEKTGEKRFLPELYTLLEDEGGHVRKDAVRAVSRLGDSGSVEKLLPLLHDEYKDVTQAAADALIKLGREHAESVDSKVRAMLDISDPGKKELVLGILAGIGAPDWLELCLKAAQDEEPVVRTAAVKCLGRSGDPSVVRTVVNCLADESAEVRVQAAIALEELQPEEAVGPLRAALHDQDPWVRSAALSSFSVQPTASPEDLSELLASDDLLMKTSAAEALGKMAVRGHESALGIMVEVFRDGGKEMKQSICRILGSIPGAGAFALLFEAARDDDPGIRTFAAHALAQRDEPEAVSLLAEAAEKDTDRVVRETARSLLETRR